MILYLNLGMESFLILKFISKNFLTFSSNALSSSIVLPRDNLTICILLSRVFIFKLTNVSFDYINRLITLYFVLLKINVFKIFINL